MDESPPATSPPEPAAPDENAAQEKPRRERRRLRVPTSVIVTVLVAALSVWVAPAFTRQWDDRQKARDLQASTAELISSASANALGETLAYAAVPGSVADIERLRTRWLATRHRITARLDAYFSPSVSREWNAHGYLVGSMIDVLRIAARRETGGLYSFFYNSPDGGYHFLEATPMEHRAMAIREVKRAIVAAVKTAGERSIAISYTAYITADDYRTAAAARGWVSRVADAALPRSVAWVLQGVHEESPRGFSTTRGDLLRDLLP